MNKYCRTCKKDTHWKISRALKNTWKWMGDFLGDKSGTSPWLKDCPRGVTVSETGPPNLHKVWKCSECGRSVTI